MRYYQDDVPLSLAPSIPCHWQSYDHLPIPTISSVAPSIVTFLIQGGEVQAKIEILSYACQRIQISPSVRIPALATLKSVVTSSTTIIVPHSLTIVVIYPTERTEAHAHGELHPHAT